MFRRNNRANSLCITQADYKGGLSQEASTMNLPEDKLWPLKTANLTAEDIVVQGGHDLVPQRKSMTLPRRMTSSSPRYRSTGPVRPAPPPPLPRHTRKPTRKAPLPPRQKQERSLSLSQSKHLSMSTGCLFHSPAKLSSSTPPPIPSSPRPSSSPNSSQTSVAVNPDENDENDDNIYELTSSVSDVSPPPLPRRPSPTSLPPSVPPLSKHQLPNLSPVNEAPPPPKSFPSPSKPPIPIPVCNSEEEEGGESEYCDLDDAIVQKFQFEQTQRVPPTPPPRISKLCTSIQEEEDSVYIEMSRGHLDTRQHQPEDDYVEMTTALRLNTIAKGGTPPAPIPPKPKTLPKPSTLPKPNITLKRLPKKRLSVPSDPPAPPPVADDRDNYEDINVFDAENQELYELIEPREPVEVSREDQDIYEAIGAPNDN